MLIENIVAYISEINEILYVKLVLLYLYMYINLLTYLVTYNLIWVRKLRVKCKYLGQFLVSSLCGKVDTGVGIHAVTR